MPRPVRVLVLLVLLAVIPVLLWPRAARLDPVAQAPSDSAHHDEPHAAAPGPEVPKHDDNPEDLDSHLPIQVYYHLEHVNQPWRAERREATYEEMGRQGAVLILLQGLVAGLLWRRRKA